jgi:hypothetical protein
MKRNIVKTISMAETDRLSKYLMEKYIEYAKEYPITAENFRYPPNINIAGVYLVEMIKKFGHIYACSGIPTDCKLILQLAGYEELPNFDPTRDWNENEIFSTMMTGLEMVVMEANEKGYIRDKVLPKLREQFPTCLPNNDEIDKFLMDEKLSRRFEITREDIISWLKQTDYNILHSELSMNFSGGVSMDTLFERVEQLKLRYISNSEIKQFVGTWKRLKFS